MSDFDLTPAQIKRLQPLADLNDEDIATLLHILRKEQAWGFMKSHLKGAALFFVSLLSAVAIFFDSIKSFFRSIFQ